MRFPWMVLGVAVAVGIGVSAGRLLANCYVLHDTFSDWTCPSTGDGCPQPTMHSDTPQFGYCANWIVTITPRFDYYQALLSDDGITNPVGPAKQTCGTVWVCQWQGTPAGSPTSWDCNDDHPLVVNGQTVVAQVDAYGSPVHPDPCP